MTGSEFTAHYSYFLKHAPTIRMLLKHDLLHDRRGDRIQRQHYVTLDGHNYNAAAEQLGTMVEHAILADLQKMAKEGGIKQLKADGFVGPFELVHLGDGRLVSLQATPDVIELHLVQSPTVVSGKLVCSLVPLLGSKGIAVNK